jgi:hypothetical protein
VNGDPTFPVVQKVLAARFISFYDLTRLGDSQKHKPEVVLTVEKDRSQVHQEVNDKRNDFQNLLHWGSPLPVSNKLKHL